jgi:hypothetical protein
MARTIEDQIGPPRPAAPEPGWEHDIPLDQTPPPDHEEFELVSASGLRAIRERHKRRLREMTTDTGGVS